MQAGRDLALLKDNADYVIHAMFESAAAFEPFSVHNAYMAIICPALGHYMASYGTAQFES